MKYLAIVTNTVGRAIFFEVKIFEKNNVECIGYASTIFKEEGGYSRKRKMIYCDICVPDLYMEEVSKDAIEEKCKEVIDTFTKC